MRVELTTKLSNIMHGKNPFCPECLKRVDPKYSGGKFLPYCSRKCNSKHYGVAINCKECSTSFTPALHNQQFCSKKCRVANEASKMKSYNDARKRTSDYVIFERDNFKCVYCGASAHNGALLHVDHIYPKSLGGKSDVFNLVSSCSKCNLVKHSTPLSEKKTMQLWKRNLQLDIKFGTITSYDSLVKIFNVKHGIKPNERS